MNPKILASSLLLSAIPAFGASVIVNEINAYTNANTPVGGQLGDWFEVVVVGDGTAGSTVDMRSWSFRIDNNGVTGLGFFQLSNHSYWSNVVAGTILTFHEDNAGALGVDTSILGTNNLVTQGWAHTNIWVGDSTYVNTTNPSHDVDYPIDNQNAQVAIFDSASTLIFGPAGENHAGYAGTGVGSDEVFKLEEAPSPLITLTSAYNDGGTQTFGRPNEWTIVDAPNGVQNFSAFKLVPEPSGTAIAALGLLGIGLRRRRA